MPLHAVTVSASYDPATSPSSTRASLEAWAGAADGRTFVVDDSIAPVRWTATVDYQVDATDPRDAERQALERFAAEPGLDGITDPETVLAATGPLG